MRTRIAVLGDRNPDLVTHRELDAALASFPAWAEPTWVPTDSATAALDAAVGVWVVPCTPYRDDDAVYAAIRRARETGLPLLGTCGGFQYAIVEFARNAAGLDAAHAETAPDAETAVIAPLACSLVGEERTVTCVPGTRLAAICGSAPFSGFHWCAFGLDEAFVAPLVSAGLVVSARAEDAGIEGFELADHPFFLATLFQPQVGALAGRPLHPLIEAFLEAGRSRAMRSGPRPGVGGNRPA